MSSTMPAVCGRSSLTSVPHLPRFANFHGLPKSDLFARCTKLYSTSPLYSLPLCFVSSGFGSKRSTWLGPPCMNSEIIAFAFGAKCGFFAARLGGGFSPGLAGPSAARSPSRCSKCASAKNPTPAEVRDRNARRVAGNSIDIEELVRGEKLLAEVSERGEFGVLRLAGQCFLLILEEPHREPQFVEVWLAEVDAQPRLPDPLIQ